ncbi:MAG TPA: S8 family peptidase [Acidimicrobiales bacterium]
MGKLATARRLVAVGALTLAGALGAATVSPAAAAPAGTAGSSGAAASARSADAASAVGDAQAAGGSTWIVTLESGAAGGDVSAAARTQLDDHRPGARPLRVFRHALRGYTARLTAAEARALADEPGVARVEPDVTVRAFDTQPNAPWGLDRIDQRTRPLSGTYTYGPTGQGVTAYVIDTGIRLSHRDFGGRAVSGFDAVDGGSADDCNGHGTHVASTVGGSTYGVAKGVQLVAVRVLDCNGNGSASGVIAGIDWAVGHHQAGQPAVANFSLGGTGSTALDQAVGRLIDDGVTVVAAAGNSGADACGTSPARVPAVITVAASTQSDALASFSNRGSCVDVIAPGVNVPAAWATSDTATNTISGTSMASPHVAGAVAKHLQGATDASPAAVSAAITQAATQGQIAGTQGGCWLWIFCTPATPNRLLFSN